jgi:hydrogenase maturation protease
MSRADHIRHTVTIIGVGSPFGADQVGWLAVDWLERSELCKRFADLHLNFYQADRPGALLLEQLHDVDAAIIIDAMQSGLSFGTLRTFTLDEVLRPHTGLVSSHAFGVSESLALGASLGALPRLLTIVGIEMGDEMREVLLPDSTAHQLVSLIEERLICIRQSAVPCERC